MSDLCSPVYVVMDADEELTFWCFVSIMNRMVSAVSYLSISIRRLHCTQKQNFLRDQSGMKKQLSTLQQLIHVMDPELYRHLGSSRSRCKCIGHLHTTQRKRTHSIFSFASGKVISVYSRSAYTHHVQMDTYRFQTRVPI